MAGAAACGPVAPRRFPNYTERLDPPGWGWQGGVAKPRKKSIMISVGYPFLLL